MDIYYLIVTILKLGDNYCNILLIDTLIWRNKNGFIFLVRHGEPDYSFCDERGYIGHGRDLAPLSENGIQQLIILTTAKNMHIIL